MFTDGAHRQLGLPRHADLANDEHIQRNAQGVRHQGCDGNTAPRQTQDQAPLNPLWGKRVRQPTRDLFGQEVPGIGPVPKHPPSLHLSALSCGDGRLYFLWATAKIRRKAKTVPNGCRG